MLIFHLKKKWMNSDIYIKIIFEDIDIYIWTFIEPLIYSSFFYFLFFLNIGRNDIFNLFALTKLEECHSFSLSRNSNGIWVLSNQYMIQLIAQPVALKTVVQKMMFLLYSRCWVNSKTGGMLFVENPYPGMCKDLSFV